MPDFLNPDQNILKHGPRLPHWQQGEVIQFVTFRLADSLPETLLRQWREEREIFLQLFPRPWTPDKEKEYHGRFTRQIEHSLDTGAGSCLFRDPQPRQVLADILMRFQGERAHHHSWVIMPNHVHLLFTPVDPIDRLMKAWKGASSRGIGRGPIWQSEYRDTLIRDGMHFINAVRYIRKNPAKLPTGSFTLWEGERALAVPTLQGSG